MVRIVLWALLALKASHDVSPVNAYLDLEERKIHDDRPGQALDVWASLPALEAAARQAVPRLELVPSAPETRRTTATTTTAARTTAATAISRTRDRPARGRSSAVSRFTPRLRFNGA